MERVLLGSFCSIKGAAVIGKTAVVPRFCRTGRGKGSGGVGRWFGVLGCLKFMAAALFDNGSGKGSWGCSGECSGGSGGGKAICPTSMATYNIATDNLFLCSSGSLMRFVLT